MELKWQRKTGDLMKWRCSNRTFMELKWQRTACQDKWKWGSNRTFMELKFNSRNTSNLMPLF